jgi:hypothetical protein
LHFTLQLALTIMMIEYHRNMFQFFTAPIFFFCEDGTFNFTLHGNYNHDGWSSSDQEGEGGHGSRNIHPGIKVFQ